MITDRRPYSLIFLLAGLSELLYLGGVARFPLLSLYSRSTDLGGATGYKGTAAALFVLSSLLLFGLFGLGLSRLRDRSDAQTLKIVLGIGGVFASTMVFMYPITAIDIYDYVAQSMQLVLYHSNPTLVPAAHVFHDRVVHLGGDWTLTASPYGPTSLYITALPTLFVGRDLLFNLIGLKILYGSLLLLTAALVYGALKRRGDTSPALGAALIAWNPLLLFEIVANGHNDIILAFFLAASAYAIVRGWWPIGVLLLTLSALAKFATLLLIPLLLIRLVIEAHGLRERLRRLVGGLAVVVAGSVLLYAPIWARGAALKRPLQTDNTSLLSLSSFLIQSPLSHVALLLPIALFLACYTLSFIVVTRRESGLSRAYLLVLFALLACGLHKVETWYGTWVIVAAALVEDGPTRVAATLLSLGGMLATLSYAYIWVGGDKNFSIANNLAYLCFIVPALLCWGWGVIRARRAGSPVAAGSP